MADNSKFKEAINLLHNEREKSGVMINGKMYSMVKDRVEVFRIIFGDEYGIVTDVDYNNLTSGFQGTGGRPYVVAHARICTKENGTVLASGHSMMWVGENEISTNAPIEAAETAAVGRALAAFGLHGGEYASESEMSKVAKVNLAGAQSQKQPTANERNAFVKDVQGQYPGAKEVGPETGLFIPANDSKEDIDAMFMAIDKLSSLGIMASYYNELEEQFSWMPKPLVADINDAFKARNHQIRAEENGQ